MKKFILITTLFVTLSTPALAKDVEYTLRVDGMFCPFCIASSKESLRQVEGVKMVTGDLDEGTLKVCADENAKLGELTLTKIFEDTGFSYVSQEKNDGCVIEAESE